MSIRHDSDFCNYGDDENLISMLKNIMLNEKLNNEKINDDLRNELKQNKKSVIDILLDTLTMKENQCSLLIETMIANKNVINVAC